METAGGDPGGNNLSMRHADVAPQVVLVALARITGEVGASASLTIRLESRDDLGRPNGDHAPRRGRFYERLELHQ